jgi:hypothetical protein
MKNQLNEKRILCGEMKEDELSFGEFKKKLELL